MAGAGTYRNRVYIQGLRNGEPWPKVGDTIELSEAEAEDYLRLGYVEELGGEDTVADPADPVEQEPIDEHPVHTAVIATPDGEKTPEEAEQAGEMPGQNGLTTENGPAVKGAAPDGEPAPADEIPAPKAPRIAKR